MIWHSIGRVNIIWHSIGRHDEFAMKITSLYAMHVIMLYMYRNNFVQPRNYQTMVY